MTPPNSNQVFDKAFLLAAQLLGGKVDAVGISMLRHAIYVQGKGLFKDSLDARSCAVLHDIFEYKELPPDFLVNNGVSVFVSNIVQICTEVKGKENWRDYLDFLVSTESSLAFAIKREECKHNCVKREENPSRDYFRFIRYQERKYQTFLEVAFKERQTSFTKSRFLKDYEKYAFTSFDFLTERGYTYE